MYFSPGNDLGFTSAALSEDSNIRTIINMTSIIIVMMILFTLINLFVSVVILRYRFLRSKIQETSTASFSILKEKIILIQSYVVTLLLCRKPKSLEEDENIDAADAEASLTFSVIFRMN